METKAARSLWATAILSCLTPGLGHLYSGKIIRGLMFLIVFQLLIPGFFLFLLLPLPLFNMAIYTLISFSIYLLVLIDSIYSAGKTARPFQLTILDKWYHYVIIIAFTWLMAQPALMQGTFAFLVQPSRIASDSMAPTLLEGDYILIDKVTYLFRQPARGDIIDFKFPLDESIDYLKRVAGIPGDRVEIRGLNVYINGEIFERYYPAFEEHTFIGGPLSVALRFGPIDVPEDHLFMLGDNLDWSMDSRFWGFLEKSNINGRVRTVIWSWDSDQEKMRWKRIGRVVY